MRSSLIVFSILLAVGVAAVAAWVVLARPWATHAGVATSEPVGVPAFRHLAIDGAADVTLVQGSAATVAIEGPDRIAQGVSFDVRDGTLTVHAGSGRRWWQWSGSGTRAARVVITCERLETIRLSGGVRLRAARLVTPTLALTASGAAAIRIDDLATEDLELSGAGAIKAEFAGTARRQRITLSGAGAFRGGNLVGDTVRIAVSGAGKASVNATKALDVAISGAGNIDYVGDPKITRDISGAGTIKRRSATDPGAPERALATETANSTRHDGSAPGIRGTYASAPAAAG
jgi:hypothetical protein